MAATWIEQGTDVDYGAMTRQMVTWLTKNGMELYTSLRSRTFTSTEMAHGRSGSDQLGDDFIAADKVFVGSGGYSLKLLQKSGIPEIQGYAPSQSLVTF